MKSIIIKISAYKEKDAVVTALDETGIITFIVKGLLSSKSKNLALNNPLTIANLTFSEPGKYKYPVLKEAEIIYSPLNLMGRLKDLALVMLLADIINSTMQDEEKIVVYKYILSSLEDIYRNTNINENTLYLIFKILDVSGFAFDVKGCTNCGSKNNIVTFSFDKGGFICANCYDKSERIIVEAKSLLKLRALILAESNTFDFDPFTEEEFVSILKECLAFIEDNFGIKIKNKELII